ncbi:MAG TPA: LCP family protein [Candidatus Saccharimonadales bacterium]|nr:LCP family protein [Candidatus Saccharimonadales bacterium]
MRISKKSKGRLPEDKEFERLYRTIPNGGLRPQAVPMDKFGQAKAPQPRWKKFLKRAFITLAILLALAGLWVGWKALSNGVKIFGWGGIVDVFRQTKLKGEDEGRVNILLAGNSADDPGHGGADLTDSIMIASLDTKHKRGYIMSIPRDLYVDIPGYGYAKINEAYQDGKNDAFGATGYPPGGMGLLEKTISEHFGITLHYYALVNYTALEQAVNAVGGIDITIESSDSRGLYDPSRDLQTGKPLVDLPNGPIHLDGRTALNLARARGNASRSYGYAQSDFTRTENQRKILVGLKDKAASAGTLSNPVKLGKLLDSMGNNVETDLKSSEMRRLYALSKEIPSSRIISASLNDADGENLLMSYRTRRGQSALVPAAGIDDYSEIRAYIQKLVAPPPSADSNQ